VLAGLRAWWRGLRHLEQRGYIYIWGNLLWFALSLPIVTAPAAWAGLMHLSYVAHRSHAVNLDAFWEGFRTNFRRGLVLGALNVIVIGVNVVNLWGTQQQTGLGYDALRGLWLLVLAFWITLQLYVWPLFYAMEQPSLLGALKNAAVMIVLNPLFVLGVWLGLSLILAFSMVFFIAWALLTGGALAAIVNSAVLDRLARAGYDQSQLELP
jgi:uncharacterized membrane protein YesL